jgi:hypothetical protein
VGRAPASAREHNNIAQPAQTVTQRVEDVKTQKAGHEDARKICAHVYRLPSLLSFS